MADRMQYGAQARLVAPLRLGGRAGLGWLLIGLAVIAVVSFALNSALQTAIRWLAPQIWNDLFAAAGAPGGSPVSMLVLLGSFAFVIVATATATRLVQRRAARALIGPLPLAVTQFWRVLRLLIGLGFIMLVLPPYDLGEPLQPNLALGTWFALLPVSLVAILIQSGSEEILFRGYVQQGLAARFSNPVVWMVLPAVLFALGHYLPAQAGPNAVLIAVWSGVFGLLMADLTARAGTLGPAMAVHFINNVSAMLFVSVPDGLSGLSLYVLPYTMADPVGAQMWLPVDFAVMFVSWLAARLAIRR